MAEAPFRIGITPDIVGPDGRLVYKDYDVTPFDRAPGVLHEAIPDRASEISPETAARYDAILSFGTRYPASSFAGDDIRLILIARLGVGYDMIDVPAATKAGVMLTITPDGVRRPMATVILTFVLALAQRLLVKDRLARTDRWEERTQNMGTGLTGRTVGLIGVGNIGREFCRLARPLELKLLGHDPYVEPADVESLGIRLVDLDTLLRESDFVCVNCPLNDQTRGLLGARELALMRPTAYLINTARGPIVDERALYQALAIGRIAGAGLDVFEQEPTSPDNPILKLDNVIVTPHSLCWTDECFRRIGASAVESVLAAARGEVPRYLVNRDVLDHPRLKARLAELAQQTTNPR